MTPPKNGNAPVSVNECERKHASTTRLLTWVLGGTLLVLGFGVTSSITAYVAATGIRDIKTDIREIRTTQMEILRNGKSE